MDEPTHACESDFWDQVADWLLEAHDLRDEGLTPAQIEARLRGNQPGREPH